MTISTVTVDDTLSTAIPDDPPLPVAWEEQLCSKCMSIAFGRKSLRYLLSPKGYRHHKISELWESVASGCRLCSLIIDEFLHYTFPPEAKDKKNDIQKNPNVYVYISACNPKL